MRVANNDDLLHAFCKCQKKGPQSLLVNIQNETHTCKFTQNIIFSMQACIGVKASDLDTLAKVAGRFQSVRYVLGSLVNRSQSAFFRPGREVEGGGSVSRGSSWGSGDCQQGSERRRFLATSQVRQSIQLKLSSL